MKRIPNTMIRASAGTGKTYQLTNRFIRLLLFGAAPERIIALTFTRKAAGEFFEGILDKLAKAADGPACLLYTSPSPRDLSTSRMPSSA